MEHDPLTEPRDQGHGHINPSPPPRPCRMSTLLPQWLRTCAKAKTFWKDSHLSPHRWGRLSPASLVFLPQRSCGKAAQLGRTDLSCSEMGTHLSCQLFVSVGSVWVPEPCTQQTDRPEGLQEAWPHQTRSQREATLSLLGSAATGGAWPRPQ